MKYKLLANPETGQIDIALVNEENDGREIIGYIESQWGKWALKNGFQHETSRRIEILQQRIIKAQENIIEASHVQGAAYKALCAALEE